jgi:hypothetical protein
MRAAVALLLALFLWAPEAAAQTSAVNRELRTALTSNGHFGVPRYTTASLAAANPCNAGNVGAKAWDTTLNVEVSCNGTAWGWYVSNSTLSGGTLTLGSTSQAAVIDGLYTGTGAAAVTFKSAQAAGAADITKPAFRFEASANLGTNDYVLNILDNTTTSLLSLSGGGTLATIGTINGGGQINAAAGSTMGLTGRSRISSSADGIFTITNAATTDLDTVNFGPATPADIGLVTLNFNNTGTAGSLIQCATAASGGTDIGCSMLVTGDLGSSDTVFRAGDGGSATLMTLGGTGILTVANDIVGNGDVRSSSGGAFQPAGRSRLSSSANGNFEVTNAASNDGVITIGIKRSVEAVTTTKSPATTESGEIYSNIGDADGATVTLPAAAANVCYTFIVEAAQDFNVTADASDTIQIAAAVTAAGGTVDSSVIGDSLTLCGTAAGTWVATNVVGTGF